MRDGIALGWSVEFPSAYAHPISQSLFNIRKVVASLWCCDSRRVTCTVPDTSSTLPYDQACKTRDLNDKGEARLLVILTLSFDIRIQKY